jgi:hypothetical protein
MGCFNSNRFSFEFPMANDFTLSHPSHSTQHVHGRTAGPSYILYALFQILLSVVLTPKSLFYLAVSPPFLSLPPIELGRRRSPCVRAACLS